MFGCLGEDVMSICATLIKIVKIDFGFSSYFWSIFLAKDAHPMHLQGKVMAKKCDNKNLNTF